ncbi:MAG: chemotaxis protein CheX [Campylobacterales bacterium]|nr:chemotaxis protein CheX [Campylobacterales bacterium]MBN2832729.1 chemotaxis protein CheX [Campylobacterales bacterium]
MKEAVIEATHHFCETILCEIPQKIEELGEYFYGSAIALLENGSEHMWYLFFEKKVLDEIAFNLLFEENLSENDLDDLLKEIANQIIGSAKVLLEEKYPENNYHLCVPEFMGNVCAPFPIQLSDKHHFQVKNSTFVIAR